MFVGDVPFDEKSSPAKTIEYNQLINASPNLNLWGDVPVSVNKTPHYGGL
jgi:hypothetical protein